VKCGSGAFMKTREDSRKLAESLVAIGTAQGVRTEALLTAMNRPLGRAVGNALEVIECFEVLKARGPDDITNLSVFLAAKMVQLAGKAANLEEAEKQVRAALVSGRGLEKFRDVIRLQGGDPRVADDYRSLPTAPHRHLVRADRAGYVHGFEAESVGRATVALGAGRDRVDDGVDPAVGVVVKANRGDHVQPGEPLHEIHFRDTSRLQAALALLQNACPIKDDEPIAEPLILETISC
jgi:thymidine phosphorylase